MTIHDGYMLTEIAGQPYLLPYGQNIAAFQRGLRLNETGAFLWNALSSGKTKEELPALLAAHFEAGADELPLLREDIEQFLRQLQALGIIDHPSPYLCFSTGAARRFQIGTVMLQLNMTDALIATEFLPFAVDGTSSADSGEHPVSPADTAYRNAPADLTVSVRFGQPPLRPVGKLLVHTQDLLIIEADDCYSLLFPTSPDLIACHIDKEAHYTCFYCKTPNSTTLREELFHGIRFAFLMRAMQQGLFAVHSASILYRDQAWLFSAPSGTGKSTHAGFWHQLCNAAPLNGDLNLLGMKNGVPVAYGLPWCGTSGIFTTKTYPLGGVIFLQQSDCDRTEALSPDQRRLMLSQRIISPTWTKEMLLTCLDFCAQADSHIISFLLHCTPTIHAADICRAAIDKALAG